MTDGKSILHGKYRRGRADTPLITDYSGTNRARAIHWHLLTNSSITVVIILYLFYAQIVVRVGACSVYTCVLVISEVTSVRSHSLSINYHPDDSGVITK